MPPDFRPWQTVYDRFLKSSAAATLLSVAEVLLVGLDDTGLLDFWPVRH